MKRSPASRAWGRRVGRARPVWGPRAKRPPPARPDRQPRRKRCMGWWKNEPEARMGNYPDGPDLRRRDLSPSVSSQKTRPSTPRTKNRRRRVTRAARVFVPPARLNLPRARSGAVGVPGPRARPPEALGSSRGSRGERGLGRLLDGSRSARRRRVCRARPATKTTGSDGERAVRADGVQVV